MIDDFNYFSNKYKVCFWCRKAINSIKYYINNDTILEDLLGEEFETHYNSNYNYYFIGEMCKIKSNYLKKFYSNLFFMNYCDILNTQYKSNPVLCILDTYSNYDIINSLKKLNTRYNFKIFKLSQSI